MTDRFDDQLELAEFYHRKATEMIYKRNQSLLGGFLILSRFLIFLEISERTSTIELITKLIANLFETLKVLYLLCEHIVVLEFLTE